MADEVVARTLYMLTTLDNPFDPWDPEQYNSWLNFDLTAGYNTCGLLDRVVQTSDDLSEADQTVAIQDAIAEIVELNPSGVHRRVAKGWLAQQQDL